MKLQPKVIPYNMGFQIVYHVVITYIYPNGKERHLITFEKCFHDSIDAEIFSQSKFVKKMIKTIEGNFYPCLIR